MKMIFLVLIPSVILFSGCNHNNWYDKGYDAGWDGQGEPYSFWINKDEIAGYRDGLDDALMYDEGYDDAIGRKRPKYKDDAFYMDGYKDGKMDR